MKFAKTIKIFLMDGEPSGRMTCMLSNWTGKAYKLPRITIKDCADRDELRTTGVYLLFGKDDDGNDQVYIGEAEEILKRLTQHVSGKDFWNEAIVFISKDDNLNKAHIKYLENRLFDLAKTVKRYKVENTITPTQSSISESDVAEMEEFLENIKLLVSTLGHKTFDDKRDKQKGRKSEVFGIKSSRGADASGQPTAEGYVVFKNSIAAPTTVESCPVSVQKMRQDLTEKGVLEAQNDSYVFSEDCVFTSPSSAASVVLGRSANGLIEWKLKDGKTLKDFESMKKEG
jgi:hypothetical protein